MPDGMTETNMEHIRRKGTTLAEIALEIKKIENDPRRAWEMSCYAEGRAQSAIYALLDRTSIVKNPRLKGMHDRKANGP